MKLEICYLTPYLPYSLKVFDLKNEIHVVISITKYGFNEHIMTNLNGMTCTRTDIEHCKPILRPITDLTKKIDFNGKKIFPCELIKEYTGYEILTKGETIVEPLKMLPYVVFDLLAQMHFDLFELIPNGLAVNVNSL